MPEPNGLFPALGGRAAPGVSDVACGVELVGLAGVTGVTGGTDFSDVAEISL